MASLESISDDYDLQTIALLSDTVNNLEVSFLPAHRQTLRAFRDSRGTWFVYKKIKAWRCFSLQTRVSKHNTNIIDGIIAKPGLFVTRIF